MKRVILKRGEEERILAGHPWVYGNEVERVLEGAGAAASEARLESGELADVESARKTYLGRAFVNPRSKIVARLYSRSKEGVDEGFFKRRLREAASRRLSFDLAREPARLVFAEADFLPGLIVDSYAGYDAALCETAGGAPLSLAALEERLGPPHVWLAVQFLTAGMDSRRGEICRALQSLDFGSVKASGIVEKSAAVRTLEGLEEREGVLWGEFPQAGIITFEGGCPFHVSLTASQKTGLFLDQRENHALAAALALSFARRLRAAPDADAGAGPQTPPAPLRVLDAFCYTGGFGLHIARALTSAGLPVEVTAVDSSAPALESLRRNAALSGLSDCITPVEADLFQALGAYAASGRRFDMVCLDPPAFAKTRPALENALRGYKEINRRAISLLSGRGQRGLLVTCSCSQALDERRFRAMLNDAASDSHEGRRPPRLLEHAFLGQSADHPVLLGYDESRYLKCGFYTVVN